MGVKMSIGSGFFLFCSDYYSYLFLQRSSMWQSTHFVPFHASHSEDEWNIFTFPISTIYVRGNWKKKFWIRTLCLTMSFRTVLPSKTKNKYYWRHKESCKSYTRRKVITVVSMLVNLKKFFEILSFLHIDPLKETVRQTDFISSGNKY